MLIMALLLRRVREEVMRECIWPTYFTGEVDLDK
jgi:hypothetical protein